MRGKKKGNSVRKKMKNFGNKITKIHLPPTKTTQLVSLILLVLLKKKKKWLDAITRQIHKTNVFPSEANQYTATLHLALTRN